MEGLVEKVVAAKNFTECLGYWQQCSVEDVVLYQISEKLRSNQNDTRAAIELENLLHCMLYTPKESRDYIRHSFIEFLKHQLIPKREELRRKIVKRALTNLAGPAMGAVAAGATFLAPQAYLPYILLGCTTIFGLAYLNVRRNKQKNKKELGNASLMAVKEFQLFKAILDIDAHGFFRDNKPYLRQRLDEYWNTACSGDKENLS